MTRADSPFVGDLTWDVVGRRLARGAVAILPIGAGAKQHGLHLPMRTDAIQAEWLAERLAAYIDALVWPTVSYGHYPAFTAYAGSCSLSAELFEATIAELATSLVNLGAKAVLVLNTGISTIAPVDRALAGSRRALHLKAYDGPSFRATAERLATQPRGSHADELETSCVLAIASDLVDMARAMAGATHELRPGPMQHTDPAAPNFSASGSIGDPTLATADKGTALLDAMIEDMLAAYSAWPGARAR